MDPYENNSGSLSSKSHEAFSGDEIMKRKLVTLVPLFPDREEFLRFLAGQMGSILPLSVKTASYLRISHRAFRKERGQYEAEMVLQSALKNLQRGNGYLLLVADEDLFVPGLNFVFGLAKPDWKAAIISLIRLRQEFYGLPSAQPLFRLRALKEAIHELGHLFGLPHCPNARCVMHFSNSLADTDRKTPRFCSECLKKLKRIFE